MILTLQDAQFLVERPNPHIEEPIVNQTIRDALPFATWVEYPGIFMGDCTLYFMTAQGIQEMQDRFGHINGRTICSCMGRIIE